MNALLDSLEEYINRRHEEALVKNQGVAPGLQPQYMQDVTPGGASDTPPQMGPEAQVGAPVGSGAMVPQAGQELPGQPALSFAGPQPNAFRGNALTAQPQPPVQAAQPPTQAAQPPIQAAQPPIQAVAQPPTQAPAPRKGGHMNLGPLDRKGIGGGSIGQNLLWALVAAAGGGQGLAEVAGSYQQGKERQDQINRANAEQEQTMRLREADNTRAGNADTRAGEMHGRQLTAADLANADAKIVNPLHQQEMKLRVTQLEQTLPLELRGMAADIAMKELEQKYGVSTFDSRVSGAESQATIAGNQAKASAYAPENARVGLQGAIAGVEGQRQDNAQRAIMNPLEASRAKMQNIGISRENKFANDTYGYRVGTARDSQPVIQRKWANSDEAAKFARANRAAMASDARAAHERALDRNSNLLIAGIRTSGKAKTMEDPGKAMKEMGTTYFRNGNMGQWLPQFRGLPAEQKKAILDRYKAIAADKVAYDAAGGSVGAENNGSARRVAVPAPAGKPNPKEKAIVSDLGGAAAKGYKWEDVRDQMLVNLYGVPKADLNRYAQIFKNAGGKLPNLPAPPPRKSDGGQTPKRAWTDAEVAKITKENALQRALLNAGASSSVFGSGY